MKDLIRYWLGKGFGEFVAIVALLITIGALISMAAK